MSWYSDESEENIYIYDENDPREKLILSLKREIKVLRNENHYLREQLDFPAKPKGQLQKENDQKLIKIVKETNGKTSTNNTVTVNGNVTTNGNDKLKQNGASADESGLYEMLQEYMVENEALRSENAEMQVTRDKIRQDQQLLYRDNEKLMRKVDELESTVKPRMNQAQNSWQSMPRQAPHPDHSRSRDQSPRGSPQYARGPGSGGRGQPPQQRLPPPSDLPIRDNPALRDPVYPGSPSQGYASPTGGNGNKGKQAQRGAPLKPPHRLADPLPIVGQQRPVQEQNGPYMNGHPHPVGHGHPAGPPAQYRQTQIGSPNRANDAIRDMNEKLKQELMQLEGEIHHHQNINSRTIYGSQGSTR